MCAGGRQPDKQKRTQKATDQLIIFGAGAPPLCLDAPTQPTLSGRCQQHVTRVFNLMLERIHAVVLTACRGWSAGAGLSVALTLLLRLGRSGALVDALSPDGVPLRLGDLGIGAPLCPVQLGAVREARVVFLAQQRKAQRDSNSVAHLLL